MQKQQRDRKTELKKPKTDRKRKIQEIIITDLQRERQRQRNGETYRQRHRKTGRETEKQKNKN